MKLDQIQPTLLSLLEAMPAFAGAGPSLLIDDGNQLQAMESLLTGPGLAVLIMEPQCTHVLDQGQGVTSLRYSTTLWVRTNPKIVANAAARWNPLTLEKAIIPAVLEYGQAPTNFFQIPENLEPETDFTDLGNNSRLIRFATTCVLQ